MIAQVYLNTGNLNIDKPFDYLVPEELSKDISVGARVRVPFGGGNLPMGGYVTQLKEKSDFDGLKSIKSVTDSFPVLTKTAIELCFFMRQHYFCTFSEAARVMLPPGIGIKTEEWISLSHGYMSLIGSTTPLQQRLIQFLVQNDGSAEIQQIKSYLGKSARATVNSLIKKKICEKSFRDKRRANDKFVRLAYYCGEADAETTAKAIEKRAPQQAAVLRLLASGEEFSVPDIIALAKTSRNAVESLYVKGLVAYREVPVLRNPLGDKTQKEVSEVHLTDEQVNALNTIRENKGKPFLIHGVTGSGKTEVYLRLVSDVIKEGKQAIVLVPEISLTPQMTSRFFDRFGETVAIIHSALSVGERLDEWNRIRRKEANVVVGARSAIFAPCEDVGIIIIDEEHEQTYKSESSPRYFASDIAKFIAEKNGCPLIFASATPSVESYYNAMQGKYTLIEMQNRFNNNTLPPVSIVDMREELREGNRSVLSRALACEIQKNLESGEQTILFLNRRGYSTFVSCRECGFVFSCPSCSVSLTYHKNADHLTCHHCGHSERLTGSCPKCGSSKIKAFGSGTQKAQEQIQSIFPSARILRMDADTTSGKRGHEKLLDKFLEEKYDILIGTQMVSKGLDFENVTLVGVLAADASLNIDDFRAQERTFNLITQVCGRAGRGVKKGRGIIQTYMPENKTLNVAAEQDYKAFYNDEIVYRRTFLYPPFCDIVNIIISSSDEEEVIDISSQIVMKLRLALRSFEGVSIYGPSKAPIYKLQNRFRQRVWIKCNADDILIENLRSILHEKYGKIKSDLSISASINPYNH